MVLKPEELLPKEAPWADVERVIASLDNLASRVDALVNVILASTGLPGDSEKLVSPLLKQMTWEHDHIYVNRPGQPQQLPSIQIPPGFDLVIRAFPTNTDDIYIGNSERNASLATKRITLSKGEATKSRVSNAAVFYVDAVVANEGIEYFVEVCA